MADDPRPLVGLGVANGFAQGANIPLYNVMVAEFCGTDSLGSVLGMTVPITSLAQAFGPDAGGTGRSCQSGPPPAHSC